MADLTKMCRVVEMEIDKIADKGLNTQNIENAYKLIDMLKDIKTVEAMEDDGYSQSYNENGNSYKRHYVRGHYSRDGYDTSERYDNAKANYRNSHSMANKKELMDSLETHLNDLTEKMEYMRNDADSQEERDMIDKYISRLKMR